LALDVGEWPASRPDRFTPPPWKEPRNPLDRRLDAVAKKS